LWKGKERESTPIKKEFEEEEQEAKKEASTSHELEGEQDATPCKDLVAQLFVNIAREDIPMGNEPEVNTLGVSTTLIVELPSQTPNSSKRTSHKKSRVESPKKESNIAMLVKVLMQDREDYMKHQKEDKAE